MTHHTGEGRAGATHRLLVQGVRLVEVMRDRDGALHRAFTSGLPLDRSFDFSLDLELRHGSLLKPTWGQTLNSSIKLLRTQDSLIDGRGWTVDAETVGAG